MEQVFNKKKLKITLIDDIENIMAWKFIYQLVDKNKKDYVIRNFMLHVWFEVLIVYHLTFNAAIVVKYHKNSQLLHSNRNNHNFII